MRGVCIKEEAKWVAGGLWGVSRYLLSTDFVAQMASKKMFLGQMQSYLVGVLWWNQFASPCLIFWTYFA